MSVTYFPQLGTGSSAQLPNTTELDFNTEVQDVPCGSRYAWSWYAGIITNAPQGPLYRWPLSLKGLTLTEREMLETFIASMMGGFGTFTYLDPSGNLVLNSQMFGDPSWTLSGCTVTTTSTADPYGGTTAQILTGTSDSKLTSVVLPDGLASGFWLCASIWVKAATAQSLQIGFVDSTSAVLASETYALTAGVWKRIVCPVLLATANPVSVVIGGTAWGATALTLFGAQVVPMPAAGGYARTPGNYGLHPSCCLESDIPEWKYVGPNEFEIDLPIKEFYVNV